LIHIQHQGEKELDICVARQPIFDRQQRVFGYEILYRQSPEYSYSSLNDDQATAEVITNSLMSIGIKDLTNGKPAFINFTENMLKSGIATLLPKNCAIEILENIQPDEEIVRTCIYLKKKGYLIVLDDFKYDSCYIALLRLADIVKMDFLDSKPEDIKEMLKQIGNVNAKFLAEKVETREQYDMAMEMGFSLFQGYFFSKPTTVMGKDIPISVNKINLLHEICKLDPEFGDISKIIEIDLSLSYKLLRLINSGAFKFKNDVKSVKHALVLLGVTEIKKWACLVCLRDIAFGKPDEIVRLCLIRAKFAELIAEKIGLSSNKSAAFIIGLFSMIDVIMDRSLSDILSELPLSMEINQTLLGEQSSPLGKVYQLVLVYETGDWQFISVLINECGLKSADLIHLYIQAVKWTNEVI
jgi:c-di-GMP-related signal transduction protein